MIPEKGLEAGVIRRERVVHPERVHALVDGEALEGRHRLRGQDRALGLAQRKVAGGGAAADRLFDRAGVHDRGLHPALEGAEVRHGRPPHAPRPGPSGQRLSGSRQAAFFASAWTVSKSGMSSSHSRSVARGPVRAFAWREEAPDLVLHARAVRVEKVRSLVRVAGEVVLDDAVVGEGVEVGDGIEAVVDGAHVDVVDVEEHPAVGVAEQPVEERPLGDRRRAELDVGRRVLEDERPLEDVRDGLHPPRDVLQGLLRVGEGQQVVRVAAHDAREAEVVRHPEGLRPVGERLDLAQVVEVEGVGPADRHRDAVQDDGRPLGHAVEDVERAPARVEEVLGEGLVEVHVGLLRQDVPEVDGAEPDPHAEVGQPEAVDP